MITSEFRKANLGNLEGVLKTPVVVEKKDLSNREFAMAIVKVTLLIF